MSSTSPSDYRTFVRAQNERHARAEAQRLARRLVAVGRDEPRTVAEVLDELGAIVDRHSTSATEQRLSPPVRRIIGEMIPVLAGAGVQLDLPTPDHGDAPIVAYRALGRIAQRTMRRRITLTRRQSHRFDNLLAELRGLADPPEPKSEPEPGPVAAEPRPSVTRQDSLRMALGPGFGLAGVSERVLCTAVACRD